MAQIELAKEKKSTKKMTKSIGTVVNYLTLLVMIIAAWHFVTIYEICPQRFYRALRLSSIPS